MILIDYYLGRKKSFGHAQSLNDWSQQSHNYVAKSYMEDVSRAVYFEDVHLQMDAKLWGEEYNRHKPPKKVGIKRLSCILYSQLHFGYG